MYFLAIAALSLLALHLYATLAAAKHAECYWTGPGLGGPEDQGFSVFGTGKQRILRRPNNTTVEWYCDDYQDQPVVANWNKLRANILEMNTPCGGNGFSGDCTFGLWGFQLHGFTDPKTGEKDPVRYMRKSDDCEWIGAITAAQIPSIITIYHR